MSCGKGVSLGRLRALFDCGSTGGSNANGLRLTENLSIAGILIVTSGEWVVVSFCFSLSTFLSSLSTVLYIGASVKLIEVLSTSRFRR